MCFTIVIQFVTIDVTLRIENSLEEGSPSTLCIYGYLYHLNVHVQHPEESC